MNPFDQDSNRYPITSSSGCIQGTTSQPATDLSTCITSSSTLEQFSMSSAFEDFGFLSPSELSSLQALSMYKDTLGLTWPVNNVSFEDFELQDAFFLDTPFLSATRDLLDNKTFNNNCLVDNDTLFSTTVPQTELGYTLPKTDSEPPQFGSAPDPNCSMNPFQKKVNINDLFLPQMYTTLTQLDHANSCPTSSSESTSVFTSTQYPAFPSVTDHLTLDPDNNSIVQSVPIQDTVVSQTATSSTFQLNNSILLNRAMSKKAPQSVKVMTSHSLSSRQNSHPTVNISAARRLPYTRPLYLQEPKKRQTSGLGDKDSIGDKNDCKKWGNGHFKIQKMNKFDEAKLNTATHHDTCDASKSQDEFSLQKLLLTLPMHETHFLNLNQSRQTTATPLPSISLPNINTTTTTVFVPIALEPKKKGKGKLGRQFTAMPTKKITDSAHYRPRNAFFMFRGFVSHIQTYLHAKEQASTTLHSSICSMTSTPTYNDNNSLVSLSNSSIKPMHDIQPQQRRQSHLSLSLPSTVHSPVVSPNSAIPTTISLLSSSVSTPKSHQRPSMQLQQHRRHGFRQVQTKISVSCGKIWSSPCFRTCERGQRGCANCRMRYLFRQASDCLKLRQTEIERQIEFPQLFQVKETEEGNTKSNEMRGMVVGLEDSFNWREFEDLYPYSDLFKWHRNYYHNSNGGDCHSSEHVSKGNIEFIMQEMKTIWIENEQAYEKAFSEGARRRIAQERFKRQFTESSKSLCTEFSFG